MHRGLILHPIKGQVIPQDYLALAIKEFPSCMGAAVVNQGDTGNVLGVMHGEGPADLNLLNEIQNTYKDSVRVFFLGNHPEGSLTDDIQPFRVITVGEDDLAAVFMEGDFSNFQKANSSHSAEFQCMETALGPLLQEYFESGKDVAHLEAQLKKPHVEPIMNSFIANRGNVCVITVHGNLLTFGQNDLRKAFPWGWVSQHLGYQETPTTVAKPKGMAALFAKKPPVIASTEAIKQAADAEKAVTEPPATDTAIDAEATDTNIWLAPPKHMDTNGKIKQWYKQWEHNGHCPNLWKDRPKVRTKIRKGDSVALKKAGYGGMEVLATAAPAPEPTPTPTPAPAPVSDPATKPGTEALPILPPQVTTKLHDWIKTDRIQKVISTGGKFDADTIQAMEKSIPTFEEVSDLSMDKALLLARDYGLLRELGERVGVEALANLCFRINVLYSMEQITKPAAAAAPEEPKKPKGMAALFPKKVA